MAGSEAFASVPDATRRKPLHRAPAALASVRRALVVVGVCVVVVAGMPAIAVSQDRKPQEPGAPPGPGSSGSGKTSAAPLPGIVPVRTAAMKTTTATLSITTDQTMNVAGVDLKIGVVSTWDLRMTGAPQLPDGRQRLDLEFLRVRSEGTGLGALTNADSSRQMPKEPDERTRRIALTGWAGTKVRLVLDATGGFACAENLAAARGSVARKLALTPAEAVAHAEATSEARLREIVAWALHGTPISADPDSDWQTTAALPGTAKDNRVEVAWTHGRGDAAEGAPRPIVSTGELTVSIKESAGVTVRMRRKEAEGTAELSPRDGLPVRTVVTTSWKADLVQGGATISGSIEQSTRTTFERTAPK